jgi:hypothetical protein
MKPSRKVSRTSKTALTPTSDEFSRIVRTLDSIRRRSHPSIPEQLVAAIVQVEVDSGDDEVSAQRQIERLVNQYIEEHVK